MDEDGTTENILVSWDVPSEVVENFKKNDIGKEQFKYLVSNDIYLKELCPHIGHRIKLKSKLQDYLDSVADTETSSSINEDLMIIKANCQEAMQFDLDQSIVLTDISLDLDSYLNIPSRLSLPEFDLKTILQSSPQGNSVLNYYQKYKQLNSQKRNIVVDVLMKHHYTFIVNNNIKPEEFNLLAAKIVSLFPTESIYTYYMKAVPTSKSASGRYVPSKGKLVDKVRNLLYISGAKRRSTKSTYSIRDSDAESVESNQEAVSNDDAIWLKHNNEPWDQVCERWNNTFELRHKQKFQTVHEFLETWPILKDGKADTLILLDFEKQYKDKSLNFYKNWEHFFSKLLKLRESMVTNEDAKAIIEGLGNIIDDGGGCNFPEGWTGGWFQSGTPGLIYINSTTMQGKGDCAETDANDKFLVYDRNEDCYRCLVIHEKHKYVLQYKETYCGQRDSLSTMCESITGDAALYSMFRKEPRPLPEPCPFHPAPFTFTYSRGSGDCVNPPSRAESCTDDSRLLLRYMACPDVPGTESNVEELICLATWKEGSTRYLVGLISQVQRRNSISTDEDMYRCFVYKGSHADKSVTYTIAQSGDATCNGLTSSVDGSRTMKLTNIDDEHNRCHFPSWVVQHHKWFSLDHTHQYHFTTKNATLKIMNEDGSFEEKRLVCHSILEQKDNKLVKLVAHLTRGCESGHVCVVLSRRSDSLLELQLGGALHDAPHHACANTEPDYTPHVTLITTSLVPVRCPMLGRYTVVDSLADRRRRRQQLTIDESTGSEIAEKPVECVMGQYDSASIGCGASQDTIEFQSACTSTVYTCYGSWREGHLGLVVAGPARPASRPHALCFIYTTYVRNESGVPVQFLALSGVSRSCDRTVLPGVAGDKAYNLTINGTCEQSSKYNSRAARPAPGAALLGGLLLYALGAR